MAECVVFWQRMLTPHMTALAREVAKIGAEVHYVAEEALSAERRAMGWVADDLDGVETHMVDTPEAVRDLVDRLPQSAVHITPGVRANGLAAVAQARIMARGLRHYPIMEKVDLRGRAGWIKPLIYALKFRRLAGGIEGFLAIGEGTKAWVRKWSLNAIKPISFAYFLKGAVVPSVTPRADGFRFVFVGSLVGLKRIDLLLSALSDLSERPFQLEVIGDGPERAGLEHLARKRLSARVHFRGTAEMDVAIMRIAQADCLVLPSDKDGWGAVVSEALINGTPAVCSSECGAAEAVRASGVGGVFRAGDVDGLRRVLADLLDRGPVTPAARRDLAGWAHCLTAEAGARYLLDIFEARGEPADSFRPPWEGDRR